MANGIFAIPIERLEPTANKQLGLFENNTQDFPQNALQQFVFGQENAAVRQALECILAQQALASPLILYGASGTGKSVLSHTLIAQWFQRYPDQKALHTTGADFARMHARAVYTNSINEFRQRFLGVRLLIIDDLQELRSRAAAQQMLCNLIDHYQVSDHVMAACLPDLPSRLTGLEERLSSRLMGGVQIELKPPGFAAREVIVDQLAEQHGVTLDRPTRESLIKPTGRSDSRVNTVPKIRRALIRLRSEAELTGLDVSKSHAKSLLDQQNSSAVADIKGIAMAVSKYLNIRINDIKSGSRRQYVVRARGIAIYLCRRFTRASFSDIGQYFGRRDHSTVIHAYKKTKSLTDKDASIRLAIDEIVERLALKYDLEQSV